MGNTCAPAPPQTHPPNYYSSIDRPQTDFELQEQAYMNNPKLRPLAAAVRRQRMELVRRLWRHQTQITPSEFVFLKTHAHMERHVAVMQSLQEISLSSYQ